MISPELSCAVEFLKGWRSEGPWLLCAFHEDRKEMPARLFGPSEAGAMREWIEKWQGEQFNVYFHVNSCREKHKKAAKTDVLAVDWLHVDVDPAKGKDLRAEQERILHMLETYSALPRPTAIIFSGGGYQAFWRLSEPIVVHGRLSDIEQAERYNQQIAAELGGDNCHNADRIMRLPGTVNWPNKLKRDNGQQPIIAQVVRADWELAYPIEEFVPAPERQDRGSIGGGACRPKVEIPSGNIARVPPDRLLGTLSPFNFTDEHRIGRVIIEGEDTDATPDINRDRSRSGWFLYAVCELVRHEVPDELIFALVTDPNYAISAHPRSKGAKGMERAFARALMYAKENAIKSELAEMNASYAYVMDLDRIMREYHNPASDRLEVKFLTKGAFTTMYGNRYVEELDKDKGAKLYPLGKWWLSHPNRRTYSDVVFFPGRDFDGMLNLWRGFNVDAIPGDCSLYLEHIRTNICRGNQEYYDYLIGWMANCIQNPHLPGQTAVVMRGGQGTGKGTLAQHFGHLLGMHAKHVVNPNQVTGQFNSGLRDAVFIFADECFAVGNRQHTNMLKALITEATIMTEQKGVDAIETRNCVHLMMATNNDWAVNAELDDRRFFVLNVSESRKQDAEYFQAIADQMKNGGYEALMHLLLTYDLSGFDARRCPKTDELRSQQEKTLAGSIYGFILEKLEDGQLMPSHAGWRGRVLKDEFHDAAQDYCNSHNLTKTELSRWLMAFLGDNYLFRSRQHYRWRTARGGQEKISSGNFYAFPSLSVCRTLWDEKYGARKWPAAQEGADSYVPEDDHETF